MPTKIRAIQLLGLEPGIAATTAPHFQWINPTDLLIDSAYQRNLSRDSVTLIRKIIAHWDWAKFKPPICAQTDEGLEAIDGQHTAIAAATHPEIGQIPVMVVDAVNIQDRARSFVAHNRDRIGLTQGQIHYAALAANDIDALALQAACNVAGVELLRFPPSDGYKVGQTMAFVAIKALIRRRGSTGAVLVLQSLVDCHQAPIRADYIKAVEELLFSEEYKEFISPAGVTNEVLKRGPQLNIDAAVFSTAHGVPTWRSLAAVIFKGAKRRRIAAA